MEKFTQIENKPVIPDDDVLFNGNHIDIIKYKDTEILQCKDKVAIIPYFRDEATFLMRLEYTPAYQYKNRGKSDLRKVTNYLTVITEGIEEGETPEQTIRRGLYEEAGLVLNHLYKFDIEGTIFYR